MDLGTVIKGTVIKGIVAIGGTLLGLYFVGVVLLFSLARRQMNKIMKDGF